MQALKLESVFPEFVVSYYPDSLGPIEGEWVEKHRALLRDFFKEEQERLTTLVKDLNRIVGGSRHYRGAGSIYPDFIAISTTGQSGEEELRVMAEKVRVPRRHHRQRRRQKQETSGWWDELKHVEAIRRGLERFEKERTKRKRS